MMNLLIEYLITALILITGVAFMCSGAIVFVFPIALVLLGMVGISKFYFYVKRHYNGMGKGEY